MYKYWHTLILICIVTCSASCKKGENDPFLSLKSRQARMHGDWKIEAFEYTEKTVQPNGDYIEVVEHYEDNIITRVTKDYTESNSTIEYDTTMIFIDFVKYNFDKNGTWSKTLNTTTLFTEFSIDGTNHIYDTTITVAEITEKGDWSFLGAVEGEFKNKERFIMNLISQQSYTQSTYDHTVISLGDTAHYVENGSPLVESNNYYSGEQSTIIEIDQLKNKEMIFIEKRRNSGTNTVTPYQGIPTTTEAADFYSESKLTLRKI